MTHPITPEEAARNATVEANLRLVPFLLAGQLGNRRRWVDRDDAVQEGTRGLVRAVEKHDPAKGKLSTYARYWVRVYFRDAIQATSHPYHVPHWARPTEPAPEVLALHPEQVAAPDDWDGEEGAERRARLEAVWDAVERLREPARTIMHLRYRENLLLRQVAARRGCSYSWIQDIEARAIRDLRAMLAGREEVA